MALMNKNKDYEDSMDDNYINCENDIDNNNIDLNYEINNDSHSSKKSGEKSLQDLINMKIGKNINKTLSDMMMDENSLQKSGSQNTIDDLQKNLGSKISINSKNKENENENNHLKNNSNSTSELFLYDLDDGCKVFLANVVQVVGLDDILCLVGIVGAEDEDTLTCQQERIEICDS